MSGQRLHDPLVAAEAGRVPADDMALRPDRLGHDVGIIAGAGEVIEDPVALLQAHEAQHLDRLPDLVEVGRRLGRPGAATAAATSAAPRAGALAAAGTAIASAIVNKAVLRISFAPLSQAAMARRAARPVSAFS